MCSEGDTWFYLLGFSSVLGGLEFSFRQREPFIREEKQLSVVETGVNFLFTLLHSSPWRKMRVVLCSTRPREPGLWMTGVFKEQLREEICSPEMPSFGQVVVSNIILLSRQRIVYFVAKYE